MVSVIPRQVNRIELDKTKMEMLVGSDTTLRATVYPENTFNKKIRISSSNESIIKIDENLKLQVLSKGEATITVASEDGSVSDDYKVTAGDITLFISTQISGAYTNIIGNIIGTLYCTLYNRSKYTINNLIDHIKRLRHNHFNSIQ